MMLFIEDTEFILLMQQMFVLSVLIANELYCIIS